MQGTQVDVVDIAWGAREYTGCGPRVVPADHRPWSHSRPPLFLHTGPSCLCHGLAWLGLVLSAASRARMALVSLF